MCTLISYPTTSHTFFLVGGQSVSVQEFQQRPDPGGIHLGKPQRTVLLGRLLSQPSLHRQILLPQVTPGWLYHKPVLTLTPAKSGSAHPKAIVDYRLDRFQLSQARPMVC